jgi:hypothetical protein
VLNKKEDLTPIEYGLAHSLVRLLINQDSVAFNRFVELLKQGTPEEEALTKTYHISRRELVQAWTTSWDRAAPVGRTATRR